MSIQEGRFAQEQERVFEDGEMIFTEGDSGRELFVIQEGGVDILKASKAGGAALKIAEFKKGDFFGDMALLQGIPRFASARARGPTKLLVLQPGGFLLKIRRDPTFAFEMLQQLSERVRFASSKLLGLLDSGKIDRETVDNILKQS
jgi:CRP/FNR family cyclic AMP-dependent transcriptional regulator